MLLPLLMNNLLGTQLATFIGPEISSFSVARNSPMNARAFAGRFAATTAMTFTVVGTLPTGLSLSSAGILSGTPTVAGLFAGIVIRATDADTNTADSNAFNITVLASSSGDIGGGNVGDDNVGSEDIGGSDLNTPEWWIG